MLVQRLLNKASISSVSCALSTNRHFFSGSVAGPSGLPDFVFNNKMHVFLEIKSFFNIKYNAGAGKTNNPGLGGHVTACKVAASGEGYTQRHIFQRTTTPPYLILFYSGLCRMGRKVNLNI